MKFEAFTKCILCLNNDCDSEEHILPKSIGGSFRARFLCKSCNSTYGRKIISSVKKDPLIRSVIIRLKKQIPKLYNNFENGQLYESKDETGERIILKKKNEKMIVQSKKLSNGSLILDTINNLTNIKNILQKEKLSSSKIEKIIRFIKDYEPNMPIEIGKRQIIVLHSLGEIIPCFDNFKTLDNRVPCLMAYEYLALFIGRNIYAAKYNFIRSFLISNANDKRIKISRFMNRDEKPAHYICIEFLEKAVTIKMKLFNSIIYKIDFDKVTLRRPSYVLLENLLESRTYFSPINDAKKGIWNSLS